MINEWFLGYYVNVFENSAFENSVSVDYAHMEAYTG